MRDLKTGTEDWLETLTPDQLSSLLRLEVCRSSPDVQFIQNLLDVGCPIDGKADVGLGYTALHHAANILNLDMMKFLISKGADVNVKNNIGETALDTHNRVIRLRKNIAKAHELIKQRDRWM